MQIHGVTSSGILSKRLLWDSVPFVIPLMYPGQTEGHVFIIFCRFVAKNLLLMIGVELLIL